MVALRGTASCSRTECFWWAGSKKGSVGRPSSVCKARPPWSAVELTPQSAPWDGESCRLIVTLRALGLLLALMAFGRARDGKDERLKSGPLVAEIKRVSIRFGPLRGFFGIDRWWGFRC